MNLYDIPSKRKSIRHSVLISLANISELEMQWFILYPVGPNTNLDHRGTVLGYGYRESWVLS